MNKVLGTKMKLIYGYKGGGALNMAVERGETQGRYNFRSGFTAAVPTWLPQKKIIPIIQVGPRDSDPVLKGVPHMQDLLKPGSIERRMYDVLGMNLEVGQAFYVPQGTPNGPPAQPLQAPSRKTPDADPESSGSRRRQIGRLYVQCRAQERLEDCDDRARHDHHAAGPQGQIRRP